MEQVVRVRTAADLGLALQVARESKGLTQEVMAARVNIERSYLSRLERGLSTIALERSLRILRRLGAEVTVTIADAPERA